MTKDRFQDCLAETLKWEGGYSNDPVDPGGATMKGVIQEEYDAWRSGRGLTCRSVREIGANEVSTIYRENYWQPLRCSDLPPGVDLAVFDFGVNSGVGVAIKKLQRAVGVAADGHIGSITLDAVRSVSRETLIPDYMNMRRAYLRQIKTFWRFGKGWLRRCDGVEIAAKRMALTERPTVLPEDDISVTPPVPLSDADAQSATQGRATAPDKTSMAQSKTGWAAVFGGGGTVYVVWDKIWETVTREPERLSAGIGAVLSDVAARPSFWAATGIGAALVFVWLDRRRRLADGG